MNNKGFTLIELLAVVVLMSVIGVIAYVSIGNSINISKEKAEDKFLNEISKEIESYLGLYGTTNFSYNLNSKMTFAKNVTSENYYCADVYKLNFIDGEDNKFTLQDIIDDLHTADEFKNPRTDLVCNASNVEIVVYKDSDFVYYYYVKMTDSNIGCTTDGKDIDTRPSSLKNAMENKSGNIGNEMCKYEK